MQQWGAITIKRSAAERSLDLSDEGMTSGAVNRSEVLDQLIVAASSIAISVLIVFGVGAYPVWLVLDAVVVIYSPNPDAAEQLMQAQLTSAVSCLLIIVICLHQWWRRRTYVYGIVVTAVAIIVTSFVLVAAASFPASGRF